MKNALAMMTSACALTAALVVAAPAGAAPSLPYKFHTEQNIDNHQVGYVDVVVNADGSGAVTAKFSNGQQIRGNTFAAETALVDKDGHALLVVRQTKGLDGSWGGHAREGTVTNTFQLSPEKLQAFDRVVEGQMRALNDGITPAAWNTMLTIIGDAFEVIGGGDVFQSSSNHPSPPGVFHHMF